MSTREGRGRRALPLVLLGVALVLVAAMVGRRDTDGPPLDPRSTRPLGTRGLVVLLEESGADVTVSAVTPDLATSSALLLQDDLDPEARRRLANWTRAGGVLVVADPLSEFVPAISSGGPTVFGNNPSGARLRRQCDLVALREVRRLEPTGGVGYGLPREGGMPVAGAVGCFPRGDGWFVVARPFGAGTVVAIGGAATFVNGVIGEADNGALAVSLLAARAGSQVRFLEPTGVGGGRASLPELIPGRVEHAVWQLAIAFAIYALWRGRRLGRPVEEPQPVAIPGAELVVAVGHLLQQAKRRDQAAAMLRLDLARSLGDRLGLPPDAAPEAVAAAIAAHTRFDVDYVTGLLRAPSPENDEQLLLLARSLSSIRQEVVHAR